MKRIVAFLVMVTTLLQMPPAVAGGLVINTTTSITAEVPTIGQIWKGDIPTSIEIPTDSFSEKLEFPITAILPIIQLTDRSLGVQVEFAIWSDSGVKIGSETIYSFSWNPVGPKTMVGINLYANPSMYGKHTMLVTTSYYLSTNGLISKYLKDEQRLPIEIKKLVPQKVPSTPTDLKGEWVGSNLRYKFTAPESYPSIINYEIGIAQNVPGSTSLYYEPTVLKKTTNTYFEITPGEFLNTIALTNESVIVRVRAVNAIGNSSWNPGVYTPIGDLNKYGISLIPPPADLTCEFSASGIIYKAKTKVLPASMVRGVPTSFDWEYSLLNSPELTPTLESSYGVPVQFRSTNVDRLDVSLQEILVFSKQKLDTTILVKAIPRNDNGSSGIRGNGCYISVADLSTYVNVTYPGLIAAATKAAAELKIKEEAEAAAGTASKAADAAGDVPISKVDAASKIEIQAKLDDARVRLEGAKVKAAGATTDASRKIYNQAIASWTSAISAYESKLRAIDLTIKNLEDAKIAAELKAKQDAEAKAAAVKKTTITCVKGKLTKKVTAVKPKCPAGYKVKK
jgi:hypothetical protein